MSEGECCACNMYIVIYGPQCVAASRDTGARHKGGPHPRSQVSEVWPHTFVSERGLCPALN
jgi:hypothetical protein